MYYLILEKEKNKLLDDYKRSTIFLLDYLKDYVDEDCEENQLIPICSTMVSTNELNSFIEGLEIEKVRKNFTGFYDVLPRFTPLSLLPEYSNWRDVIKRIREVI